MVAAADTVAEASVVVVDLGEVEAALAAVVAGPGEAAEASEASVEA